MKTAMQELWDWIDANCHEETFNINYAREKSFELEKIQIINAIAYGNTFPEYQSDIDDIGESYYKWTYLKTEEDKQNLKNLNLKK